MQREIIAQVVPLEVAQVAFLSGAAYLAYTLGSSGLGPEWGIATGFAGLAAWGFARTGARANEAARVLEDLRAPASPLPVGPGLPVTIELPRVTVWIFRIVLALFALLLVAHIIDAAREIRGSELRPGLLLSITGLALLVIVRSGSETLRAVTLSLDRIDACTMFGRTTSLFWAEVQAISRVRYRGLGRNGLHLYDGSGALRLVVDLSLPRYREIESTIRTVLARHAAFRVERRGNGLLF